MIILSFFITIIIKIIATVFSSKPCQGRNKSDPVSAQASAPCNII